MASAPSPDAIDKQEAFAAIARQAADRPVVGQNGPFLPPMGGEPYVGLPWPNPAGMTPGGLVGTAATPRQQNALLPNGAVRLDGQQYRWAELANGDGAWIVVVS